MALKLPTASSSGCSSKIRASDLSSLLGISGNDLYQTLAKDCGRLGKSQHLYSSIDTISPITRDPGTFALIALCHAVSDLYAAGVSPLSACMSIGLTSPVIRSGDGTRIVNAMNSGLASQRITLAKAHSYLSEETHLTLALVGSSPKPLRRLQKNTRYSIVLSKELGASTACHQGWLLGKQDLVAASEKLMTQGHGSLLSVIRNYCSVGTTDISGFGLLGHIVILAFSNQCRVSIDYSAIPFFEGLDELALRNPACSAQRNEEDFEENLCWKTSLSEREKRRLFAAETAGPIAFIVPAGSVDRFVRNLHSKGFIRSRVIGSLIKSDNPLVEVT